MEENELSNTIGKSREFPSPNVFSSREGIFKILTFKVGLIQSSKYFCEDLRRKLTARNLESPKNDWSHEDKSCGKIELRTNLELGNWDQHVNFHHSMLTKVMVRKSSGFLRIITIKISRRSSLVFDIYYFKYVSKRQSNWKILANLWINLLSN